MTLGMFIALVALPVAAVGVALPDGNEKIGQSLAASLTKSLQKLKALENQGLGEEAEFHRSMMETLMSKQEVLANPEVAEVVARANSLADRQNVPEDAMCARDWSQTCPDGWEIVGGSVCSAPVSYKGGCASLQRLSTASTQSKLSFASSCKAPWPCIGSDQCPQARDYDTCPLGWASIGGGFCRQHSPGSSWCASVFNFGNMEIAEKQGLAKDCELKWACRPSCERDFSAECPEGWQKQNNLCVAPAHYAGDCGYSMDTLSMNDAQKRTFASRCAVQFPCVGQGSGDQKIEVHNEMHLPDGPIRAGSRAEHVEKMGADLGLPQDWFDMPSGPVDSEGGIHF